MPITNKSLIPTYEAPLRGVEPGLQWSSDWSWASKQEFSHGRAWTQAYSPMRRGTLSGGPTFKRFLDVGNERQWSVVKPTPVISKKVLTSDEQDYYERQFGAIDLNLTDPMATLQQVARQSELITGSGSNPLAFLGGAESFLQSKDISLFENAPARAADYALALPIAVANKIMGRKNSTFAEKNEPAESMAYRFQKDPRYWSILGAATPEQLDQLAYSMVSQYMNPDSNSYMVEKLRKQFDSDRKRQFGLESGNEAIDYVAFKSAPLLADYIKQFGAQAVLNDLGRYNSLAQVYNNATSLVKFPGVGTLIAQGIDGVTKEDRAAWESLPMQIRQQVFQLNGLQQTGYDLIAAYPVLSAAGAQLAALRSAGGLGQALAGGYDLTLRAGGWMMTTGLTFATANWALEAAWSDYSEFLGEEIDRARPVSSSNIAGVVNTLGYWSNGTWGAWGLTKGISKAVKLTSKATTAGLDTVGIPHPSMGRPEPPIIGHGLGGSAMDRIFVAAGADQQGLHNSAVALDRSYTTKIMSAHEESLHSAVINGERTGTAMDEVPLNERIEISNDRMRAFLSARDSLVESAYRIRNAAQADAKLFQSDAEMLRKRLSNQMARTIEDLTARRYVTEYDAGWVTEVTGQAYSEASMRQFVQTIAERRGWDFDVLSSRISGEQNWLRAMRKAYHYEFDLRNGDLASVTLGSHEVGKLTMVRANHLFEDMAAAIVAALRSTDKDVALAEVQRITRETIEGRKWFNEVWRPKEHSEHVRENVNPEQLAKYIEDIQPALLTRRQHVTPGSVTEGEPINLLHSKLAEEGLWELAFKPVNEEGEFISHIKTRDDHVFQTPFLDYAVSSEELIQMGNRGYLGAKLDGVFHGFRTWRIGEFQKAALYRNLTGRFAFSASQVEEFHKAVFQIAEKHSVQPQTIGTVGHRLNIVGIGRGWKEEVNRAAERAFGKGPWIDRNGNAVTVDWSGEIARSYRQSLRLNLTAGLTSHVKNFGAIGEAIAFTSDIAYIAFRFGLSPLFKAGELFESFAYNGMRGVDLFSDPYRESLMYRQGVGSDMGAFTEDRLYDQMIAGIDNSSAGAKFGTEAADITMRRDPAAERTARSYIWYAGQMPKTFEEEATRRALQAEAADLFARIGPRPELAGVWHEGMPGGPQIVFPDRRGQLEYRLAELIDEQGNILPGADQEVDDIVRVLNNDLTDAEVRDANRVGQVVPEAYSLDPLDMFEKTATDRGYYHVRDSTYPEDIGLSAGDTTPDERGMWHATTNVDAVHESGLKSRLELAIERAWDEHTTGLREALASGDAEYVTYIEIGTGRRLHGYFDTYARRRLDTLRSTKEAKVGASPETIQAQNKLIAEVNRNLFNTTGLVDNLRARVMQWDRITTVYDRNGKVLWRRPAPVRKREAVVEGLGAGGGNYGWDVSVTTSFTHAEVIAARMRLQIEAANGTAGSKEILDHFMPYYMDAFGADAREAFYSAIVMAPLGRGTDKTKPVNWHKAPIRDALTPPSEEHLAKLLDMATPEQKFYLIKYLDQKLNRVPQYAGTPWQEVPTLSVGLLGSFEAMRHHDPAKIGVVQVAAKRDAEWHVGPDNYEMQFPSEGLWVVDQRIIHQPLPDDEEGLLRAINLTVREDGVTVPGMERYQASAVAKLDGIRRRKLPLNPGRFEKVAADSRWAKDLRVEMVPVSILRDYREFDRNTTPSPLREQTHLDDMTEWMRGQRPDDIEPVIIEYDPFSNTAIIADGNHRITIADNLGWDAVPARVTVRQKKREAPDGSPFVNLGKAKPLPDETLLAFDDTGYIPHDARPSSIFTTRGEVDRLEDVFGSPERLTDIAKDHITGEIPDYEAKVAAEAGKSRWSKAWETFWNPIPYKQAQSARLEGNLMRRSFRQLLELAGNDDLIKLLRKEGLPEVRWSDWLMEDRVLEEQWLRSQDPADLAALLGHSKNPESRGQLDALYESEEWTVITSLWAINGRTQADAAFGVHFFNPYRSAFERSINHPLFGVYPASWAYKAAREWARFLFENRMFGDGALRLGMSPAVALANIQYAQSQAFAMMNTESDVEFSDWIGRAGPIGSTAFIFNLMMPGDWSDIPFPLSRTIRDVVRGERDPYRLYTNVMDRMGLTRDIRLGTEMLGEAQQLLIPEADDPNKPWRPHVTPSDDLYTRVKPAPVNPWAGEPLR